ncbi:MAG: pyrimidine 5'-nucleotidase [Anaerolineae bacterium]|nr:pyrimidine 5'-nucleotidase [Anaerolineae bacterium]
MLYKTLFIDLDETVYPSSTGLWEAIRQRIDLFLHEKMHFSWEEIPATRQYLYSNYGTTLRGLKALYHIDENFYLDFVHDIPLQNYLKPDPELRRVLKSYPQRKFIFTNADANHAKRVLEALQISDCFEDIIDIHTITPYCKPMPEAYHIALKYSGEDDAAKCVLIDDTVGNLATARESGFFTIRVGSDEPSKEYHQGIKSLIDLPLALKPHPLFQ